LRPAVLGGGPWGATGTNTKKKGRREVKKSSGKFVDQPETKGKHQTRKVTWWSKKKEKKWGWPNSL